MTPSEIDVNNPFDSKIYPEEGSVPVSFPKVGDVDTSSGGTIQISSEEPISRPLAAYDILRRGQERWYPKKSR